MELLDYAIPAFILLLIGDILWSFLRDDKEYRYADTFSSLSCGILNQFVAVLFASTIAYTYLSVFQFRFFSLESIEPWIVWTVGFVGVDFCYYWFHRSHHRVNLLWASHIVHHSSEEYNLSVALRQSAVGSLFGIWFYLPLALLGIPLKVFLFSYYSNLIYQFWIHTQRVRKTPFWFEAIMNTPSHHRAHHGINPQYIDRNYAGVLIIWDKIFGTFVPEVEKPRYGITKQLHSFNPFWAQFHYFVELIQRAVTLTNWREKLSVWWKPPEWSAKNEIRPTPTDWKIRWGIPFQWRQFLTAFVFFVGAFSTLMILPTLEDPLKIQNALLATIGLLIALGIVLRKNTGPI